MRYHKFHADDVFCALLPEVKARSKSQHAAAKKALAREIPPATQAIKTQAVTLIWKIKTNFSVQEGIKENYKKGVLTGKNLNLTQTHAR